jgi:2-keto-3-deoxy-L-rhamnonate aldolase RhmA
MSMNHDVTGRLRAATSPTGTGLRRGLWVSFLGAYGLELAVTSGADWVGIDLQHGDLQPSDVPGLLRVTEQAGLPLLTRMPSHDPALISRAIDAGVNGVIVPAVESAHQAKALVSAALLPPRGARSTGTARSTFMTTKEPVAPLLLPMVETATGLEHAAEILSVDGVDGVFFGPYDLTISSGFPTPSSKETLSALEHVITLARAAGKTIGFMAGQPELLAMASRANLVAVDTDVAALRIGLARLFD